MMIIIGLFGYILILGIAYMTRGEEIDQAYRLIEKRLTPLGIEVDITLHSNKTVSLSATKRLKSGIQHASIHGVSLIEAIWKLIKHIEHDLSLWIEKETY